MTNYEHYKKDINPYIICNLDWAFVDGRFELCDECNCNGCLFAIDTSPCDKRKLKWIGEEYKESEIDWSKVPVDTKILVSSNREIWYTRYFAKFEGNCVHAFDYGATSWSADYKDHICPWKYAKLAEDEK